MRGSCFSIGSNCKYILNYQRMIEKEKIPLYNNVR